MLKFMFKDIQEEIKSAQPPTTAGRSKIHLGAVSFNHLVFLTAQAAKRPYDYFVQEIKSKTIVGKRSKHPIEINGAAIVAAMSF
ncbi:MAG: hypothetical protein CO161_02690, partial [Candidatus Portnoybacteria bacterium CG_4_9_14_3_um_filter_44_9]